MDTLKKRQNLILTVVAASHMASSLSAEDTPDDAIRCLETDQIEGYKVESDERIRFKMKDGGLYLMRLKRHCPQLHFHRYISYTPVNGKICAGPDDIKTRAGLSCRIASLERIDTTDTAEPTKTASTP